METLKFKKHLVFLLLILILLSCIEAKEEMVIINYGTKEFKDFENKNHNIDLAKSWELYLKFQKKDPKNNLDYFEKEARMFFIVNNNYVYTLSHINLKKYEGYFLNGIWVNADTGEIKEHDNTKRVKAENWGWNGYWAKRDKLEKEPDIEIIE